MTTRKARAKAAPAGRAAPAVQAERRPSAAEATFDRLAWQPAGRSPLPAAEMAAKLAPRAPVAPREPLYAPPTSPLAGQPVAGKLRLAVAALVGAALAGLAGLFGASDAGVAAGGVLVAVEPFLTEILLALLLTLGGFVAAWIRQKTGVDIEAGHREALHSAIVTGLNASIVKRGAPDVGAAIAYAQRSVPDALRSLHPSPHMLTELTISKLPQVTGGPSPPPAAG